MVNKETKIQAGSFLVYGGGAREHAIAQKLSESGVVKKLFLASPNDGFKHLGDVIEYSDFEDLAKKAKTAGVDILLTGPENPLCEGITDIFKKHGIKSLGVSKKWSRLESSKHFAKKFMEKHGIKTAKYLFKKNFDTRVFDNFQPPYVIKADGLCKGKGVTIAHDKKNAENIIKSYLRGEFGTESKSLLIEEFLDGEELSLMSLWDGKTLLSFVPARDFKRINSDPLSANTGGMGAFCPVPLTPNQQEKLENYEKKLQNALKKEHADFTGFLYSGLIWHDADFYVLEYNVRLGDPETQALLTHLASDFGELCVLAAENRLNEAVLEWKNDFSACLVLSADSYPKTGSYGEKINNLTGSGIYFAGVKKEEDGFYTNGGRILSVCADGLHPFEKAVEIAQNIDFKGKYFRKDLKI